jgi:[acyl-carrier-protein] S-malonyltransferase
MGTERLAIVFPGQGAQALGMGRTVAEASPRARSVFHRAGELLGFDVADLCFNGPAEELERTDIQQPAIFIASVAVWEAYLEAGGRRDAYSWAAGLSLGEYTALHVAGAVEFDDALRLVRRRGQLMQEASIASPSGMVSLVGADEPTAMALCARARGDGILAPANFNCPGQIVISGSREACDRAVDLASKFGCRGVILPVAGAFHSPLMEPAARGLEGVLRETTFAKPAIPVLSNVNGEAHTDPESIRDALRRQVTEPVLWQRCVERMMADGATRFVEMGPGRVLTGLMRKINRKVPITNVGDMTSVTALIAQMA